MFTILKNIKLKTLLVVLLVALLIVFIVPNRVQAASFLKEAGGAILEGILDFFVFLGDSILNILQQNFISTDDVVIEAESKDFSHVNTASILKLIIGLLIVVVAVVIAVASFGSLSWASAAAIGASLKLIGGVILYTTIGGAVAVWGGIEISDSLKGKFDLPQMRFTPYEIFSNQIPVFDINFINPKESVKIISEAKDEKEVIDETAVDNVALLSYDTFYQAVCNALVANKFMEEIPFIGTRDGYTVTYGTYAEPFLKNSEETYLDTEHESKKDRQIVYEINDGKGTTIIVTSRERYYKEGINAGAYSILQGYNIYYYKIEKHEVQEEKLIKEYKSSSAILQKSISTWYKVLRRIALVGLLSVLVYVGIRIILTSAAADKAKYKKMFVNWLVAVCLLFMLHYIMVFILTISTKMTEIFFEKGEPNIMVKLPYNTTIYGNGLPGAEGDGEAATADNPPVWSCSFTGYLRLLAGAYGGEEGIISLNNFAYAIMYLIMVIYTLVFTFMYLKRCLYMAFLTMIAPLITLTYPLDKIKDGQAQALGLWLREYIFNALIQPIHLMLYIMIVSSVMEFVTEHPVYAIVTLGFLLPAEKFIRSMFGFEKAGTLGKLADAAGGAAVMGAMGKLSNLNKKTHSDNNNQDDNKIRTADEPSNIEVPEVRESKENAGSNSETSRREPNSSKSDIRTQYKALKEQGLDDVEIGVRLRAQFGDTHLIQDVINEEQGTRELSEGNSASSSEDSSGGSPVSNSKDNSNGIPTQSGNLSYKANMPNQAGNSESTKERSFGSKLSSGLLNVGRAYQKRNVKAQPLRTIGKYTSMAIGGTALGILGLTVGIASGDASDVVRNVSTGVALGGSLGKTWGENIIDEASDVKENFKKGYLGNEEYNNRKFDKNFTTSSDLREMINNRDLHSEMSGGMVQEIKRSRQIANEAHEYHKNGITDREHITTFMKIGLTPEEGQYAIELAKTMKKNKVDSEKKRQDYYKRYKEAMKGSAKDNSTDKKIETIWEAATKIRFK